MADDEIRGLLQSYVEKEMSFIEVDAFSASDVKASKKYQKKMKKLWSTEKYFGRYIYTGYAIRWAAIVALCVLSLFGVNQVSAKIFGFNPWNYITSYIFDFKMEQKIYTTKEDVFRENTGQIQTAKRDAPTYIPVGVMEVQSERDGDDFVFVIWQGEDEEHIVHYGRDKIVEGATIATDAEYEKKEKCVVGGYEAYFYRKKEESWMDWTDDKYYYHIFMKNVNAPKEELIKMAKSIYK